eukprot:Polyplicarium_translucidae@DN5444_c0_g1_i1.p1
MASASELGISEQEFQDAMNLEKIYGLVQRGNDRCSKDGASPVTHVDMSTYQFLCRNCATGRDNVKRIGDDRFKKFEVERLEKKCGSGGGGGDRKGDSGRVRKSRGDKTRRSRKPRPRSPSPSDSESDEESEEETHHRGSRRKKSKPRRARSEDFGGASPYAAITSAPAGMATLGQPPSPVGMFGAHAGGMQQMHPHMGQHPFG